MRRDQSLERMSDEHELEVVVKHSLLGDGRQRSEQVDVAVDACRVNAEV